MKLPKVYLRDLISERLKFLSPAAPQAGFPLRSNKLATGYFGIFTTAHRAVVPHFRFKKDLILYLNSSRAAPKVGISVSLQQAAGNSNLKLDLFFYSLFFAGNQHKKLG
jgi:hypothetical protein